MAILSGLMFTLGRERIHYIWGIFCIAVAVWAGAFYMVTLAHDPEAARFWWKISFTGLILNPFIFFHFVLEFINDARILKIKKFIIISLYTIAGAFLIINLATNLIINGITFLFNEVYYNTPPGVLHPYFMTIFVGLVFYAHYIIYQEYRKRRNDALFQQRVRYFFLATFIAYVGGSMNFLPVYGIEVPPVTSISVAIGSSIIAYTILRYKLFNIRVVTAQLLTLILAGLTIFRLIVSASTQEIIFNALILATTLFVGVYLILSVRKEVEQREEIQELAGRLKSVNSVLAHDVKAVLGKNKDMFSVLLEGTFGPISDKAKPFLERSFVDTRKLIASIVNILASGRDLVLTVKPFDLREAIAEVVNDVVKDASAKHIAVGINMPEEDCTIVADRAQLTTHTLKNLMENAINYNLENGSIAVNLSKKDAATFLLMVKDTGIGIKDDDKPNLFREGGCGKESLKVNVNSTGYGLVTAKKIVEAHGGKIWFESEGISGQGTTFFVELPAIAKISGQAGR